MVRNVGKVSLKGSPKVKNVERSRSEGRQRLKSWKGIVKSGSKGQKCGKGLVKSHPRGHTLRKVSLKGLQGLFSESSQVQNSALLNDYAKEQKRKMLILDTFGLEGLIFRAWPDLKFGSFERFRRLR